MIAQALRCLALVGWASCFALLSTSPAVAQQVSLQEEDGKVRVVLRPSGTDEGPPVVLAFDGQLFPEGVDVLGPAPGAEGPAPAASVNAELRAFLKSYFEAWRTGTYEQVLEHVGSGEAMFRQFFPQKSMSVHRTFYESVTQSLLRVEVRHGNHLIVVVQHVSEEFGGRVEVLGLETVGSELAVSYSLLQEPVFHFWRQFMKDRVEDAFEAGR